MTEPQDTLINDGNWDPVMTWLNQLADAGRYEKPLVGAPPITRNNDGSLNVENPSGIAVANIGDAIHLASDNEFHVVPKVVVENAPEPDNGEGVSSDG